MYNANDRDFSSVLLKKEEIVKAVDLLPDLVQKVASASLEDSAAYNLESPFSDEEDIPDDINPPIENELESIDNELRNSFETEVRKSFEAEIPQSLENETPKDLEIEIPKKHIPEQDTPVRRPASKINDNSYIDNKPTQQAPENNTTPQNEPKDNYIDEIYRMIKKDEGRPFKKVDEPQPEIDLEKWRDTDMGQSRAPTRPKPSDKPVKTQVPQTGSQQRNPNGNAKQPNIVVLNKETITKGFKDITR